MLPTSNPHPKRADDFAVTVLDRCPLCTQLQPDVTQRQRARYWLHPPGQSILYSCGACYAADAPPETEPSGWWAIDDEG